MELTLFVASIPVVLICMFVYKSDTEKEPKNLLSKLFLWGAFIIVPIIIIELLIAKAYNVNDNLGIIETFLYSFIGISLIEEGAKWLVTYNVIYNNKEFNHPYDAIVYSVFASLGFALIENLLYVLPAGLTTGILRSFTSIPAHTCTGVIMGYYLGMSRISLEKDNKKESNKYMLYAILIPSIVHTLYDFILMSNIPWSLVIFIVFTIFMYVISIRIIKKTSTKNIALVKEISGSDSFMYAFIRILIIVFVSLLLFGILLVR